MSALQQILVALSGASYWFATLGGTGAEGGGGVALDASGNVYVVGTTASQGAGGDDLLLAKYNANGDIQWQRSLGGTSTENGNVVAVDASGNVYVTGTVYSEGTGAGDLLLAKYNSAGAIQWQRSLGEASRAQVGNGIAVDSSGNIYVSGTSYNDILLAKYNSSGTIQWQVYLNHSEESGYGLAVDSSGNAYLTGSCDFTTGFSEAVLVKYNSSGVLQWQRRLGGAASDLGFAVAVDSSGNVYLSGQTSSEGAGGNDVLLAKYNSAGAIQWQRRLGGAGSDVGRGVALDSSANVYVTGYTSSEGAGGNDMLLAKYDTSGTILWQRSLGGTSNDTGVGIAVDSANGVFYVIGNTASTGAGGNDLLLAKLPIDGTRTGTYGSLTYAARTLTNAGSTLTDAASSLSPGPSSHTDAARTLTDAARTLTSTKTTM